MAYGQPNQVDQNVTLSDVARESGAMSKVYAWMTAGVLITGAIAMFIANTPALLALALNPVVLIGTIITQFAFVIAMGFFMTKIPPAVATLLFLAYSALTGVTMSFIFLAYTTVSIAVVFFITAGMFGALSAYGYFTKRDLSGWGGYLVMGLVGFLLASVVNAFFFRNEVFYWILTYGGVILFMGLTIYDTQRIKRMLYDVAGDPKKIDQVTIFGALKLYLDFINLFLLLLRIFGDRR